MRGLRYVYRSVSDLACSPRSSRRRNIALLLEVVVLQTLVWINTIVVGLVMVTNAALMLISPSAWFRLPDCIRAQGFWFEAKWARGGKPTQVRLTGAFLLALVVLAACGFFLSPKS
jgi:hypothetical protein